MRNLALLMRKDMISTWAMMRLYLLVFALSGLALSVGNAVAGMAYVPIVLIYFLTYGLAAYEERYQAGTLAFSLPVTLEQFVTARYLFCLGGISLYLLACYLCNLIPRFVWGEESTAPALLLLYFCIMMLFVSVVLPLIYRFGVTKSRFLAMGIYLVAFLGGSALSLQMAPSKGTAWQLMGLVNPLALLAIPTLGVALLSWRLCIGLARRYRLI